MQKFLDFFFSYIAKPFIIVCLTLALAGFGYVGYTLLTLSASTQTSGTNNATMIATPQGSSGGGVASAPTPGSSPTVTTTTAISATPTPQPPAVMQPAQTPAPQPTQQPTIQPPPTATPTPQPSPSPFIQPGVNGNPWGYDFNPGSVITNPPAQFCQYFACIPSFWQGNGYVEECQDGTYSLSGGISGSCSYHKGDFRPLYQHH